MLCMAALIKFVTGVDKRALKMLSDGARSNLPRQTYKLGKTAFTSFKIELSYNRIDITQ